MVSKVVLAVGIFLVIISSFSFAAHPTKMSLQGSVEGLIDGNLGVKVSDSNSCTTVLYDQNYLGAIQQGSFNLLLGDNHDLNLNYNTDYYLCLSINGEAIGGAQKFVGGQGQIHAKDVNASEFSAGFSWDSNVGIGTPTPKNRLNVVGDVNIFSSSNSIPIKPFLNIQGTSNYASGIGLLDLKRSDGTQLFTIGEYNHNNVGERFGAIKLNQDQNGLGYYGLLFFANAGGTPQLQIEAMPIDGTNMLELTSLGKDGAFTVWGNVGSFRGVGINNGRTLPGGSLHIKPEIFIGTGAISDDCSGNITGYGTAFTTQLHVGSVIYIPYTELYANVISIADNTHMEISGAFCDEMESFYYYRPTLIAEKIVPYGESYVYDTGLVVTGAGRVGIGTSTPSYSFEVYSGDTNVISIYSDGSVSAKGYITHTAAYDKSRGSALSFIKDSSQLVNSDGKVDDTKFDYSYVQYPRTIITGYDIVSREVETAVLDEQGNTMYDEKGEKIVKRSTIKTQVPITQTVVEGGVSIDNQLALLQQAIYEQQEEIGGLKGELCRFAEYSWCSGQAAEEADISNIESEGG